ncbi:MAG: hypothetical protein D6808_01970 [Candidatus Dadabacteria bacterium]|nr:MAG: hypothetical protein D6808_01970 [Candidatus Dadabacteria bacterium]
MIQSPKIFSLNLLNELKQKVGDQNILALDFSTSPPLGLVTSASGVVSEVHALGDKDLFSAMLKKAYADSQSQEEQEEKTEEEITDPSSDALTNLSNALTLFSTHWRTSVLILPSTETLSLNIELPFKDTKQIEKILPMEVQDIVPFKIEEFHLVSRCIAPMNGNGFDIHVDLIKKWELKRLISALQSINIDPRVVCLPAHALASAYWAARDYFRDNCCLLWRDSDNLSFLGVMHGEPRITRSIQPPKETGDADIYREMRLTIGYMEKRYEKVVEKVYCLGSHPELGEVQGFLGRDVEEVKIGELIKLEKPAESLAPLVAIQVLASPQPALTNFRSGQFKYRPRFRELIAGLRTLVPYVVFLAILAVASVGLQYYLNTKKIDRLKNAITNVAKGVLKSSGPISPSAAPLLMRDEIRKLEDRLKSLGSLSSLSTLESFAAVSQDLPSNLGLSIYSLSIKENRVNIKGTAPDYSTLDKIEAAFKKKPHTYCKVKIKEDVAFGRRARVGFIVSLEIC